MPYIIVNQLKTYYIENTVEGTPLLFIHGWLGSSLEWIYQYCYFKSKNHVILIDLPGFGKSEKPNRNYTIDFYSEQVIEFLNLYNNNEVILVGHSLGGMIAQNITVQNPKLVKRLILISTTASITQSFRNQFELFWVKMIFKLGYRKFLKSVTKQILSTKTENREFIRLYNNALKIPKAVVLNSFKSMTSKSNISRKLSCLSQPTLILYGNKDKIISKPMVDKLGDLIPCSDLLVIDKGSHRLMIEKHQEVNQFIENFINS